MCLRSTKRRKPVRRLRITLWPRLATGSRRRDCRPSPTTRGWKWLRSTACPVCCRRGGRATHGDDAGNTALLLAQLRDVPDERRSAAFVSACALVSGSDEVVVRGEWPGAIAREPRGDAGFGYDPVFIRGRRGSHCRTADFGGKGRGIASRSRARAVAAGFTRAGSLSVQAHKLNCAFTFRVWKCSTMIPSSGMVPARSTPIVFRIGHRTLTARLKAAST